MDPPTQLWEPHDAHKRSRLRPNLAKRIGLVSGDVGQRNDVSDVLSLPNVSPPTRVRRQEPEKKGKPALGKEGKNQDEDYDEDKEPPTQVRPTPPPSSSPAPTLHGVNSTTTTTSPAPAPTEGVAALNPAVSAPALASAPASLTPLVLTPSPSPTPSPPAPSPPPPPAPPSPTPTVFITSILVPGTPQPTQVQTTLPTPTQLSPAITESPSTPNSLSTGAAPLNNPPATESSSALSTGAIVGTTLGAVFALILAAFAVCACSRRVRHRFFTSVTRWSTPYPSEKSRGISSLVSGRHSSGRFEPETSLIAAAEPMQESAASPRTGSMFGAGPVSTWAQALGRKDTARNTAFSSLRRFPLTLGFSRASWRASSQSSSAVGQQSRPASHFVPSSPVLESPRSEQFEYDSIMDIPPMPDLVAGGDFPPRVRGGDGRPGLSFDSGLAPPPLRQGLQVPAMVYASPAGPASMSDSVGSGSFSSSLGGSSRYNGSLSASSVNMQHLSKGEGLVEVTDVGRGRGKPLGRNPMVSVFSVGTSSSYSAERNSDALSFDDGASELFGGRAVGLGLR